MRILTFSFGDLLTNTYFCLDEAGGCAVIDPGLDGEAVWDKLSRKGLCPTHILLTHGHFDHARGVRFLREKSGAEVLIHRADAPMLSDPYKAAASFYYRGQVADYPVTEADRLLEEGDEILCGSMRFRVLHTPGHTPGSVCFAAGDTLFCGDTLFAYGYGRTDLYGGDDAAMAASLERLAAIPENLKLCPGHGNSAHLDGQRDAIAGYIRYLRTGA
ncbi:MAG: MBL fold metallo-hydrolase [Clostridia bacterium]|nr:MBL fold metallo-hydrolase [Clostridia bacterium]